MLFFYSISTFVCYLIPKVSFFYISGTISPWAIRWFISIARGISPKVNVIAILMFELSWYNVATQHVNHCAVGITCT